MSPEDVTPARKREDAVARCSFGLDVHCPMAHVGPEAAAMGGLVCRQTWEERRHMLTEHRDDAGERHIAGGSWYDILRRAGVRGPDEPASLRALRLGRPLAMASLRVMGPSMATGQAAGDAAALAAAIANGMTRAVDVNELQRRLRANGAAV